MWHTVPVLNLEFRGFKVSAEGVGDSRGVGDSKTVVLTALGFRF